MDTAALNLFIHPMEQRVMIALVLSAIVWLVVFVLLAIQAYKGYRVVYNLIRTHEVKFTAQDHIDREHDCPDSQ